jgi:replication factor C large subunit
MAVVLWVDKYKPERVEDVAGHNKAIGEMQEWLHDWKPGKAMLIYGPPGIGKTLIVEVLARQRSYLLVQMNASDERSQKSIDSFLGSSGGSQTLFHKGKFMLIDEVDGISSRDRGAANSIVKVIKESKSPVFLIANDPWIPKLRPLRQYCTLMKLNKLPSPSVEKRLREIAVSESIAADPDVLRNLARWSQGDMRSAITDLQVLCHGRKRITEKELETLGFREREAGIFNILPTIFHSGSMSASTRAINNADLDPDEIMLWVENNISQEMSGVELAQGYDVLSRADLFRSWIRIQQNWRFKRFMVDMISGISLFRTGKHGFISYKPPQKLIQMSRTKIRRATMDAVSRDVGKFTHSSVRRVRRDYLPFLKIILNNPPKKRSGLDGFIADKKSVLVLDDDDAEFIRNM